MASLRDLGIEECPICGEPLSNWGAISHGDGDISDEIGCDNCEEPKYEVHADYCTCNDCQSGLDNIHRV